MNDLGSPMRQILDRELRLGERLVWSQQPPPAAMARKYFNSFLFGIPFCAFAIFWTIGASGGFGGTRARGNSSPGWFPIAWGSMFIIAGLAMMLNPVWAYWRAFRTIYAITDQRAIIIEARWPRKVRSFVGESLANVDRTERNDGTGDISLYRRGDEKRTQSYHGLGFVGIQRVKEVEDLLRKLYDATSSSSVATS